MSEFAELVLSAKNGGPRKGEHALDVLRDPGADRMELVGLMDVLFAYLNREWMTSPAVWGVSDCCISVLDWVSFRRGGDWAAELRYSYDDFGSAQRAWGFFIQPRAACDRFLAGLNEVPSPARGDVACFKWAGHQGRILPTMGICICVAPGVFACRGAPEHHDLIIEARPAQLVGAWAVEV